MSNIEGSPEPKPAGDQWRPPDQNPRRGSAQLGRARRHGRLAQRWFL